MAVEAAIDAAAAVRGQDVHALHPPEVAVSPVAPFLRDEQSTDDFTVSLGEHIKAGRRPREQAAYASAYDLR